MSFAMFAAGYLVVVSVVAIAEQMVSSERGIPGLLLGDDDGQTPSSPSGMDSGYSSISSRSELR
jgi:hypothetical protein